MNDMDKLFSDMIGKGLAYSSDSWIQWAIQQKHPRLTLDLANSVLLTYSGLDKAIVQQQNWN